MFVVFQILNLELDITRTILFYLGNLLFSQRFFETPVWDIATIVKDCERRKSYDD